MNYQEALDALNFMANDSFELCKMYVESKEEYRKNIEQINNYYFILKELVDRSTPKNPYYEYGYQHCGNCGESLDDDDTFCSSCGQRVSDEDTGNNYAKSE